MTPPSARTNGRNAAPLRGKVRCMLCSGILRDRPPDVFSAYLDLMPVEPSSQQRGEKACFSQRREIGLKFVSIVATLAHGDVVVCNALCDLAHVKDFLPKNSCWGLHQHRQRRPNRCQSVSNVDRTMSIRFQRERTYNDRC
jgi:hypothetical protein